MAHKNVTSPIKGSNVKRGRLSVNTEGCTRWAIHGANPWSFLYIMRISVVVAHKTLDFVTQVQILHPHPPVRHDWNLHKNPTTLSWLAARNRRALNAPEVMWFVAPGLYPAIQGSIPCGCTNTFFNNFNAASQYFRLEK